MKRNDLPVYGLDAEVKAKVRAVGGKDSAARASLSGVRSLAA
jgi:hypothetical protein